jgi:predicted 2-oxoglutarate/Fe(II)-dependent dioxygenase YbiX
LFTIKYSMDTQRKLNLHHDMSLVSGSLKLNNNYTGGELYFPRQGVSNSQLDVGSIILWPGQVTHPHECKELESGVKYSLTLWTSRLKGTDDIYTG